MKKKLFLTSLLVFVIVCLFAIGVSAKSYTVNYGGKETAQTDENGVITIRDTAINTNLNKNEYTIKDANGNDTVVTMQFLGWYADDGSTFAPGETVTLTEDIYLYQASGTTVYDYSGLQELLGRDGWYVKLGADITTTNKVSTERTGNGNLCVLDLNGFNITSSSSYAFGDQRSGLKILGKGTVTHTGNGGLFSTKRHGSYDGDQRLYIGKKVTVTTTGFLFYTENDLEAQDGIYEIRIYGDATAKNLSNLRKLKNASVTIYEGATLTLTGDKMFVSNDITGGEHYMTLSLGGTIRFTNPDSSSLFNDFMLTRQFTIAEITNGSFTVSSADSEIIAMFLPETLMLKDTENEDGTTTYNVVEADCVHDWVLNIEQSTAATPGATGFNIFDCSKCGTSKRETTVYSPTSVEIEITVDTGDGERTITVLAGDVLDLQFTGTGSSALCYIAGLKDTADFTADQIVAFDIPAGVGEFFGFANSTVETINILDGAEVEVYSLAAMTGIKNINVGAATVNFETLKSSTVEIISNKKAGAIIKVGNQCFSSGKSIKHFEMISGSTYVFGTDAFRSSTLEEVIIPDNSTVTFGQKSFAETTTIKYVYVGANAIASKKIGDDNSITSVFGGNSYLSKVVLMDITYIGKWSLSTKKPGNAYEPLCDLVVYAHSEDFSFHAEAFNDRAGDYTVYIYTADADMSSATSSSNYVIYKGLGHAYKEDVITESTCVTQGTVGYITDCPCEIDYRDNAFTSVANKKTELNGISYEAYGKDVSYLPLSTEHTLGTELADIVYENYFENGKIYYYCSVCNTAKVENVEESVNAAPLFEKAGYSYFEQGEEGSISYTIKVKKEAIDFYTSNTGKELVYGLVVGSYVDGKPVIDANTVQDGAVMSNVTNNNYTLLQTKVLGIKAENKSAMLNMCAYAIDNEVVRYISDSQTLETAESLSLSILKERDQQQETTVPSGDEE